VAYEMLNFAKPLIDTPIHFLDIMDFDFLNPPVLYESPLLGDNAEADISGAS